jgi:methylase of polypeptide subunit release factors
MSEDATRIHEVDFCARVAMAASRFLSETDSPFAMAQIEGYGTGSMRRKRKDLRFFDHAGRLALTGEVRMPGAPDDNPYGPMADEASRKADNAGVKYFFTWDVNRFVLWDRSRWDAPLLERRVREWKLEGRHLRNSVEVGRTENLEFINTKFLPKLLLDLGRIYRGQQPNWPMAPDDLFIQSLERALEWPIETTRIFLASESAKKKDFDRRLQDWMVEQGWAVLRKNEEEWNAAVERAARTLAHLLANRLIFYQALRARFGKLPRLQFKGVANAADAWAHLQRLFARAVKESGDYEPLFYPAEKDWAGRQVFEGAGAIAAWQRALNGIERYDFGQIGSDVVGKVFQRLVSPEERHRWGQHFTGDDAVDLINAFCIREADGAVLDPACGSGSFLVRAYYRKQWLRPYKPHVELLSELFGCDISLYPAHLATLNLAAREINDEANYPRIARRDFFDVEPTKPFCRLPPNHTEIALPRLRAIVGNPPYVRQEKIGEKEKVAKVAGSRWHGLRLSGRSDMHCYFWPAATALLEENGYFGFLTSSSWLDVEYGFALQKWVLQNFKLVAVMESAAEPWFEDARVKTCATILQRCEKPAERGENLVRFVRVKRKLAEIIGERNEVEERFAAFDELRDKILSVDDFFEDDSIRVIAKPQRELWQEGLRAAGVLSSGTAAQGGSASVEDDGDEEDNTEEITELALGDYAAGKWGRYLRAPDLYFEIMREFGTSFVPLGELVTIRRGITSGCDAFFMPHDITREALAFEGSEREFKGRYGGASRAEVMSGTVKIVRAGDGSVHPIDAEYLKPEVHSLMSIERPVVTVADLDRVVLLVDQPLEELKGRWVGSYLRLGEKSTFDSRSTGVPVSERSTCAARNPWYDLTKSVKQGFAFWPMAQQYRHIIAHNRDSLICNHNLFDLLSDDSDDEHVLTAAILNSTLVALFKTFYGRFAGTEGNLKTEVIDVNLIEIPDPRKTQPKMRTRILEAFGRISRRSAGRLVEEQLMACHSPEQAAKIASGPIVLPDELRQADRRELDDAVFELIGVKDAKRRRELVERLYEATAAHFREIRVVEIQKMVQKSKSKARRYSVEEIANDAWEAVYYKDEPSIAEWIANWPGAKARLVIPPEGEPRLLDSSSMFDREVVYFGKERNAPRVACTSRAQAELVARMAELGMRGSIEVAEGEGECRQIVDELEARLKAAETEFETLASERVAEEKKRAEIVAILRRWRIRGKASRGGREEMNLNSGHDANN